VALARIIFCWLIQETRSSVTHLARMVGRTKSIPTPLDFWGSRKNLSRHYAACQHLQGGFKLEILPEASRNSSKRGFPHLLPRLGDESKIPRARQLRHQQLRAQTAETANQSGRPTTISVASPSGARALPASLESRNTCFRSQWVGWCSWIPRPVLKGRPGTTAEFFRNLLVDKA
jgi:hypothetical protein